MATTNAQAFQTIIEDPPTKDLITTCGFIAVDSDPKLPNPKAGFALVEVNPDVVGFSFFMVWELAVLPLDNESVNDFILAVNEQKQIDNLYIDLANFAWFNAKRQWSQSVNKYLAIKEQEKKEALKQSKKKTVFIPRIPSLRPLGEVLGQPERGKDPLVRQLTTLEGAFERGQIQLEQHLEKDPHIKAELSKIGNSVICDALAGAIYKARDIQKSLRTKFGYSLVQHDLQIN